MACIPGERQLVTLQQISCQGAATARGIQLNRELTAAGLNGGGAPEGKQVLLKPPIRLPQQRLNAMPKLVPSIVEPFLDSCSRSQRSPVPPQITGP